MDLKVNIFQFDIQWLDPEGNMLLIKNHLESIRNDVDLVILPEMYLSGFCMNPKQTAIQEDSEELHLLIKLAKDYNVALIGSLAIEEDGKYFNRVHLITEEGIMGRYDKQRLYSPSGENDAFESKYDTNLMIFKGWRILPQVCYDLRFPEDIRSMTPPDLIIYMANWPEPRINHWDTLIKARAIENLCWLIGCNRLGTDGNNWKYPGHSKIIQPNGNILEPTSNSISSVYTLTMSEVKEYRVKYRFLEDK